jgi:hypothetical protein
MAKTGHRHSMSREPGAMFGDGILQSATAAWDNNAVIRRFFPCRIATEPPAQPLA